MKTNQLVKTGIYVLSAIVLIVFISSCHKEGTGGKSAVNGLVKHHDKPIPNAIVYIKYGATEFPGTNITAYDDHVTGDANSAYAFKNLRKGNYYLYGVGWDSGIMQQVSGGLAIKLKYNKSETTDVPVTE